MNEKTAIAQEKWVQLLDQKTPFDERVRELDQKIASYFRAQNNPPIELIEERNKLLGLANGIGLKMDKIIEELDSGVF